MDFAKLYRNERRRLLLQQKTGSQDSAEANNKPCRMKIHIPDALAVTPLAGPIRPLLLSRGGTLRGSLRRRIGSLNTIVYCTDFLSEEEESICVENLETSLHPWNVLKYSRRKVQAWGKIIPGSENTCDDTLPPFLQSLSSLLVSEGFFSDSTPPNNVLINQYESGQGIMPHTDGPAYYPKAVILSLCSDVVMTFFPNVMTESIGLDSTDPIEKIVLRRRSIILFRDEAYTGNLHSIAEVASETISSTETCPVVNMEESKAFEGEIIFRAKRFSLTFRHVS